MAFATTSSTECSYVLTTYLTPLGRKYFFDSQNPRKIVIKLFSLSDRDINYSVNLELSEVPTISGDDDECIKKSASCINYTGTIPFNVNLIGENNPIVCDFVECLTTYCECEYVEVGYVD